MKVKKYMLGTYISILIKYSINREIFQKAESNIEQEIIDSCYDRNDHLYGNQYSSISDFLMHGFYWRKTPEGDVYWDRVCRAYRGLTLDDIVHGLEPQLTSNESLSLYHNPLGKQVKLLQIVKLL